MPFLQARTIGSNPSGHLVVESDLKWHHKVPYSKKFSQTFSFFRILRVRRVATCSSRVGNVWHVKYNGTWKWQVTNRLSKFIPLTIPHGLVVRIRAFHARGRGSIPRGGDIRQISANNNFFRPLIWTGGFDPRAGEHQCLGWPYKKLLPD